VLHDALVEQDRVEVSVFYTPCSVWQAEDIVVASTGASLVIPDHVMGVDDLRLYAGLMAFAASRGITVEHRGLHGPRGLSSGGRISLQHGDSEAVQLPVLAHEIIHELLHHSRTGRQLPKTTVESEAETGAAVLMQHHGHDVPATPAYLRNHNVRPADVLASMDRIIRATSEVVEFMERWEREQ